jgi:hypothetical protein
VAFAEGDRKVANCGASVTRALGGVGTGVGVGVEEPLVEAGGFADSVGVTGEAGNSDCNGLTGAPEERGEVDPTSAASTFAGATTFSADVFAVMAATCVCSEGRTLASTLTGITGDDTGSARGISVGGVTGFEVGQLSTPPTWNVLHHGQRPGWLLSAGVESVGTTAVASGAVLATGAAIGRKGSKRSGVGIWTDGRSRDLAGALVAAETAAICRRSSSTSR